MIINIINKNIVKATYGQGTQNIDVTELIKTTLNYNIIINNTFFKKDPCFGSVKELNYI